MSLLEEASEGCQNEQNGFNCDYQNLLEFYVQYIPFPDCDKFPLLEVDLWEHNTSAFSSYLGLIRPLEAQFRMLFWAYGSLGILHFTYYQDGVLPYCSLSSGLA